MYPRLYRGVRLPVTHTGWIPVYSESQFDNPYLNQKVYHYNASSQTKNACRPDMPYELEILYCNHKSYCPLKCCVRVSSVAPPLTMMWRILTQSVEVTVFNSRFFHFCLCVFIGIKSTIDPPGDSQEFTVGWICQWK